MFIEEGLLMWWLWVVDAFIKGLGHPLPAIR
jgi:hypothetical protein